MHMSRRNVLLSTALTAVETANIINLVSYEYFLEHPATALLLGIGFPALLIGSSILIAHDIPQTMRRGLFVGGAIIFLLQAAANISVSYLRATTMLPAEQLAPLWGMTPENLTKMSAIIFGGAINLVMLLYWISLGTHLQAEQVRAVQGRRDLNDLLRRRMGQQMPINEKEVTHNGATTR